MKLRILMFLISAFAFPLSMHAELIWDSKTVVVSAKLGESEVKGKFFFINSGPQSAFIHDIRTCCTCLIGTSTGDEVLPGKKGEIGFVFKLQGRLGRQKRQLLVLHSGPVEQRTVLTIDVNIE